MSEQKAPPRPRQVTMAGVMSVVGSLLLVISLFDTLGRLRTPETRESVADFLATPPGSGLGIDVAQAVDLMRVLALASGALAAMALVFAVFVLQRHVPARIGFTVVAALLLLTVPVAGLMPLLLAFAALLMWSQPARDWYAGRTPTERPAPLRAEGQPDRQPDRQPDGQPGGWPPSSQPPEPPPFQQPPAEPGAWQQPRPEPGGWQQPQPFPQPYAGYPAYGHQTAARDPEKRPASVTIAAVLTWIGAGATAASMALLGVVLAAGGDAFIEQFDEAAAGSSVTLSSDEVLAVGWGITGFFLIWSLVAAVLAAFAFRRSNPARIALVASAAMTALLSLLLVLSGISLVTLVLSVATVILLFTGGANDWYARRGQGYPGHPSQHRWPPPPQDQWNQPQQPQQPPQEPPGRDKPW
ncbi:MAG TPA: hypothetical protein VFG72_02405 [Marmoricola sp.]|nr:hypothetical protein [Marmoricola sp.]